MKNNPILAICATLTSLAQVQNLRVNCIGTNTGKEKSPFAKTSFRAPNWSETANSIINRGLLEKVSVRGEKLEVIDTGFADRCNNDHGLSIDGKWLVISHNDPSVTTQGGNSRIFILPDSGGVPRLITGNAPSYWHGISPNNQWVVYCAMRNGEWDVYKTHTITDEEIRLTNAYGLDDGPEYSYDGEWIYFKSGSRTMHIWRGVDGSEQTQLTSGEYDNWFPHQDPITEV